MLSFSGCRAFVRRIFLMFSAADGGPRRSGSRGVLPGGHVTYSQQEVSAVAHRATPYCAFLQTHRASSLCGIRQVRKQRYSHLECANLNPSHVQKLNCLLSELCVEYPTTTNVELPSSQPLPPPFLSPLLLSAYLMGLLKRYRTGAPPPPGLGQDRS